MTEETALLTNQQPLHMFIVLAGRLQQLEDNVKVPSKPDAQHCQKRLPDELHIDPGHRHDPECGS